MIVMVLFGGKGTVWGPVLGAAVLFSAQELVWARYPYVHPLLFGAIIVAVVVDQWSARLAARRLARTAE